MHTTGRRSEQYLLFLSGNEHQEDFTKQWRTQGKLWYNGVMKLIGILLMTGAIGACGASESTDSNTEALPTTIQTPTSTIPQRTEADPQVVKPSDWTIQHSYTGRVHTPMSGIGSGPSSIPPRFIRSESELESFREMIPKKEITKRAPAPDSDDPLLKPVDVDFSKEMIVVAFRIDTMYVHPKLDNVRAEGDKLLIDLKYPPLGDTQFNAAQSGIGTYQAIVVKRFEGAIEVLRPE